MPKYQIQIKGFLTLYHGAAGESIARIRALRVSSNHPELTAEVMKARLHGGAEHSSNFKVATSRLPPSTRRLPRGYKGVYLVTIVAEYEDTKHEWALPNYIKCRRLSMQPIKQSYHCSERHWKTSFAKHRKYMGVLRDALVRLANRQIAGNLGEWTGELAVETITVGKHRIDVVSSQHNNRLVTLEGGFDGMAIGMYERDQLINFLANNDAMSNANNLFTAYQYVGGQMLDDVINWVALNKRPIQGNPEVIATNQAVLETIRRLASTKFAAETIRHMDEIQLEQIKSNGMQLLVFNLSGGGDRYALLEREHSGNYLVRMFTWCELLALTGEMDVDNYDQSFDHWSRFSSIGDELAESIIDWVGRGNRQAVACGFAYGQETAEIQMTDHPTTTEDGVVLDPALAAKLNFHTYDTRAPMENVKYTDPCGWVGPIVKIDGEGV